MELLLSMFGWFLKPWFAAGLIALLSTLGLALRRLRFARRISAARTKPKKSGAELEQVRNAVLQVVPIHPHNGWTLEGMWHSLRVFSRSFPSLSPPHPHSNTLSPVMASSVIVNYPTKRAISLAVSTKEIGCWQDGISPQGIQVLSKDDDGDMLKVVSHTGGRRGLVHCARKRIVGFFEKYASFLDGLVTPPTEVSTETIERSWHRSESFSFLFMLPRQPSSLPFSWSFLMFNTLKEQGICLATLVMMPSQQNEDARSLVAKQLCALREHATLKSLGVYSTSDETTPTTVPGPKGRSSKVQDSTGHKDKTQLRRPRSHRILSEPSVVETVDEMSRLEPHPPAPVSVVSEPDLSALHNHHHEPRPPPGGVSSGVGMSPTSSLDARYIGLAETSAKRLVDEADGRESQGWVMVGITKEVKVMKKPAKKDEAPINSVKGIGIVKVPPTFIVRVLNDPSYTTMLDDMLKESRIIQELSKPVHLVQLLYKPVWPTAARDFSVLSILGQLDDRTWISSGMSVEDPRMPPEKGYVRAQLDIGGYLIRSVPSNPDISEVTYIARVDLKGNIPAFAVNKISESQPLCVNRLRGLVEALYAKMKSDPKKMREFEEKFPINMVVPPKPHPSTSTNPTPSTEGAEPTNNVTAGGERLEVIAGVAEDTAATGEANFSAVNNGVSLGDGGRDKGGEDVAPVVNSGRTAAGNGGERAEPSLESSETSPKQDVEEGKGDKDGSGLVISMSDLKPTEALHTPANTTLIPLNGDPQFSVGEQDGESVADSWNGEFLETYTPEQLPSDPEEEGGEKGEEETEAALLPRNQDSSDSAFIKKPSPALQLKLPSYQRVRDSMAGVEDAVEPQSLTKDTINYPMLCQGGVDYKTMANQTAAKALEEAFHVSSLNPQDPSTFTDQSNGWRFAGYEKDVVMLSKKSEDSPYTCFMGIGIIDLPPQTVFDSIRNPQLRFTYDNMLKELHIVKHVDEGLYILHLHHQTTQCFVKTSRDFCILVSERSEPNKMLLVGTSIDVPECPPIPNVHRGRIFCSGWIVEPYSGHSSTQITYMLQVDVGGLPSGLVNFVSKRQPLAVAYLRDYLISTSLDLSSRVNSTSSSNSNS